MLLREYIRHPGVHNWKSEYAAGGGGVDKGVGKLCNILKAPVQYGPEYRDIEGTSRNSDSH